MAIQIEGAGGVIAEVDGTTFLPLRTTSRPIEWTGSAGGGHYLATASTGSLVISSAADLFIFRWTHPTLLAVVHRVRVSASITGSSFFSAGASIQLALQKRTGWSSNSSGGTALTFAATCKERTTMGITQMGVPNGDFRIASTAALGASSFSFNSNNAVLVVQGPLSGNSGQIIAPGTVMFESNVANGAHPFVFVQNEGFGLATLTTIGTASWILSVEVLWSEVAQY